MQMRVAMLACDEKQAIDCDSDGDSFEETKVCTMVWLAKGMFATGNRGD